MDAFQVFASLNGTGVNLTAADRIKSLVFSWAGNSVPSETRRALWDKLVDKVGSEKLTDFFSSLYFARTAENVSDTALPQKFAVFYGERAKGNYHQFLMDLSKDGAIYAGLIRPAGIKNPKLKDALDGLSELRVKQIYNLLFSVALYYQTDYEKGASDILDFFKQAEALTVRLQISDGNPNILNMIFRKLILDMHKGVPLADLVKNLENLKKTSVASDAVFESKFAEFSTHDNKVGRFYMFRLENLLRTKAKDQSKYRSVDGLTLEHVIPTSCNVLTLYGGGTIPAGLTSDPHGNLLDRLGNMALLSASHNSSVSDAKFEDKVDFYGRDHGGYCPAKSFRLIETLIEKYPTSFRKEEVDERQGWMARLALEIW